MSFLDMPSVVRRCDVGAGAGVPAQPAEHDAVEGGVGLAVAAAVEPVPVGLAGGGGDRGDAAEHGERGLGAQPVGVVPGGDQQLAGDVGADAVQGEQGGVSAVTSGSIRASSSVISAVRRGWRRARARSGDLGGLGGVGGACSRSGRSGRRRWPPACAWRRPAQLGAQGVGGGHDQRLDLALAVGALVARRCAGPRAGRAAPRPHRRGSWGPRCAPGPARPGRRPRRRSGRTCPARGGSCGRAGRPRPASTPCGAAGTAARPAP